MREKANENAIKLLAYLNEAKERQGITGHAIKKSAGIFHITLNNLQKLKPNVTLATFIAYAEVLGYSVELKKKN